MRNLIIFGDTPFAERLYRYISIEGKDKVIAFTQESGFISRKVVSGLPVLAFEELHAVKTDFDVLLGIGYTRINTLRRTVYELCRRGGFKVATYISAAAAVYSKDISDGCFIAPGAVVGPGCKLGCGTVMESSSVLSHDNVIGDFNFLSSNAVFGGFSKTGDNCFFGLHSTVRDSVSIADRTLVGAAANVMKTITLPGGVFVGNPARRLDGKDSVNTKI